MIPIHLDLSEIINEFALTSDQAEQLGSEIINRVVESYVNKWENLVNRELSKTRSLYKKAMYVDRVSGTEVVFGLQSGDNGLAMALEEGKPPFDEKIGFSQSPKRKTSLGGGWYLTIPFRYASPQAVAESTIFQGALPKEIYQISKANAGSPVRRSQLPGQYAQVGSRAPIQTANGVIPEYVHKSPKYEGLIRLDISSTDKENRGGYFTFRRVSNNSDPNSWIHPGFEARRFMDRALDEAQILTVADMAIDEFLNQI